MHRKIHIKFLETGVQLINIVNDQLVTLKHVKYQFIEKEGSNIYNSKKEYNKNNKNKLKSGSGLNSTKEKYFFIKISDKKSSQKSTLMKFLSHIPIFSCIFCSPKVSKCDESSRNKRIRTKLALKDHSEWNKHPRFVPSNEESICKKSKISTETSLNSQSIQFLDDDIMDHANFLTHPIYLFY